MRVYQEPIASEHAATADNIHGRAPRILLAQFKRFLNDALIRGAQRWKRSTLTAL